MKTAKEQFEEWLIKTHGEYKPDEPGDVPVLYAGDKAHIWWSELTFSMQWGVYLEFFIQLDIDNFSDNNPTTFYEDAADYVSKVIPVTIDELQEAQQEAIKKAFEILDNQ